MDPAYVCPITHIPLYPAPDHLLEQMAMRAAKGQLRRLNGSLEDVAPARALVSIDGSVAYPVVSQVPLLNAEQAIDIRADDSNQSRWEATGSGQTVTKLVSELDFWVGCRATWGQFNGPHFEEVYRSFFGLSDEKFSNKRILDIGCGPLGTLEWIKDAELCIGLDPLALAYRQFGTASHSMTYVAAESERIPFPSNYFDFVSSFNSLDHVDRLQPVLKEIERVIAPGGTFLLITDIHDAPTVNEPQAFGWEIADMFPGFECLQSERLEKHLSGVYDSLFERRPFDFSNTSVRYGMFAAMFRKNGAVTTRSPYRDPYKTLTVDKLPWSDQNLRRAFRNLPVHAQRVIITLLQHTLGLGGPITKELYDETVALGLLTLNPKVGNDKDLMLTYMAQFQLEYGFLLSECTRSLLGQIIRYSEENPGANLTDQFPEFMLPSQP
jgi:ubiquinone/menaquinone biosynthesis C-methylase UbiE